MQAACWSMDARHSLGPSPRPKQRAFGSYGRRPRVCNASGKGLGLSHDGLRCVVGEPEKRKRQARTQRREREQPEDHASEHRPQFGVTHLCLLARSNAHWRDELQREWSLVRLPTTKAARRSRSCMMRKGPALPIAGVSQGATAERRTSRRQFFYLPIVSRTRNVWTCSRVCLTSIKNLSYNAEGAAMNSEAARQKIVARKLVAHRLKRFVHDALSQFARKPDDLWRLAEERATARRHSAQLILPRPTR
jgi:hypothetical protein